MDSDKTGIVTNLNVALLDDQHAQVFALLHNAPPTKEHYDTLKEDIIILEGNTNTFRMIFGLTAFLPPLFF